MRETRNEGDEAGWDERSRPGLRTASVLTLAQTADHFGVCTRTVVNVYVKQLGLRAMRLPGGWRFRAEDIAEFKEGQALIHGRRTA